MGWWRRLRTWWGGDDARGGGRGDPEGGGRDLWQSQLNPILLDALYGPRLRGCYLRLRDWEAALDGEGGEDAERVLCLLRVLMVQTQRLSLLEEEGAQRGAADAKRAQCARLEGYVEALARAEAEPRRGRLAQVMAEVCAQASEDVDALRWTMPRSGPLLGVLSAWGRGGAR